MVITIDVKGKIESAYVEAPFDKAKAELESKGYRIISLEENAKLRMQEGKDAFISRNGNYTKEGLIYLPSKEIYLTKNSPIMKNAESATECHRQGNEFYLNEKQTEHLRKDVEAKNAVKFPKNENYSIPTNSFGNDAITDFAFGKIAKDYGKFLKEAGIKKMSVYLANLENKAFARQMWLRWLDCRSVLVGYGRFLHYDYGVRGVRSLASEASTQKMYSEKQISRALKNSNLSGIEEILFKEIRK